MTRTQARTQARPRVRAWMVLAVLAVAVLSRRDVV